LVSERRIKRRRAREGREKRREKTKAPAASPPRSFARRARADQSQFTHTHIRFPPKNTNKTHTDEATSALDAATEREILDALALLSKGRTSLFVAHRLSTAAQCDQIVVLGPGGKVAEVGSHAELLARPGGAYAALWAHQSGAVDEIAAQQQQVAAATAGGSEEEDGSAGAAATAARAA